MVARKRPNDPQDIATYNTYLLPHHQTVDIWDSKRLQSVHSLSPYPGAYLFVCTVLLDCDYAYTYKIIKIIECSVGH